MYRSIGRETRRKKAKANAGSRSERSAGSSSETRGAADWAPSSVSRRYSGSQQVRGSRSFLCFFQKKKKQKKKKKEEKRKRKKNNREFNYLSYFRARHFQRESIVSSIIVLCAPIMRIWRRIHVTLFFLPSFCLKYHFLARSSSLCSLSLDTIFSLDLWASDRLDHRIEDTQKWTNSRYLHRSWFLRIWIPFLSHRELKIFLWISRVLSFSVISCISELWYFVSFVKFCKDLRRSLWSRIFFEKFANKVRCIVKCF